MQRSLPLPIKPLRVGEHCCSTAGVVVKWWRHPKGLTVLLNYPPSMSFPAGFGSKASGSVIQGVMHGRGSSSGGAGRTPGTDSGTLPVTLPEANGICVPQQPGPDQIYSFFPQKELDFQKSQVQQAGDKFVSVVSQFITLASFSFSDVEDLLMEAKELVRPPMSLRSEQVFSLTSFSLAVPIVQLALSF